VMAANLVRCRLCSSYADRHHIYGRGANRANAEHEDNILYLCRPHHTEAHTLGRDSFAEKYGLENEVLRAREVVKGY